jgi:hypothetical protein
MFITASVCRRARVQPEAAELEELADGVDVAELVVFAGDAKVLFGAEDEFNDVEAHRENCA